jgi:hypothetical protein
MPPEAEYEFDAATAVSPRASGTGYDLTVDAGWTVGPKPNGGYLLAVAARAAGAELEAQGSAHRDPLASTVHYLRAPDPGPAEAEVEVLRIGRGASQVRARLLQEGHTCLDAVFTMGTLAEPDVRPWWTGPGPFAVAPFEDCIRSSSNPAGAPFPVAIMDRTDLRLDPAVLGFRQGRPTGDAVVRGWTSFADGRPVDALGLLFLLDALPPATFNLAATGWVPTLSLTAYVRARPAPGPLRIRQYAQSVDDHRVDEVCEIWDSSNRLVGQATQLAGLRIPDGVMPARIEPDAG